MELSALDFDDIDFFESDISPPKVIGNDLEVTVRNAGIVSRGSLGDLVGLEKLEVVVLKFHNVKSSIRCIRQYAGNPEENKFLIPVKVEDGPFQSANCDTMSYELEGKLTDPLSWIESWSIECEKVDVITG